MVLDWRRRASMMVNGKRRARIGNVWLRQESKNTTVKVREEGWLERCQDAWTQIISYAELRARLSRRRRHSNG